MAAVIGDDYDFPYTSLAGFIAEFCAVGGNVTNRIWPPLGTTDYSSFITQIPKNVDGLFVGVGGSGLIAFLKQYQQLNGSLNTKKVMGNTFWPDPQLLQAIGTPMVGAVAASGIAGDANLPQTKVYKDVKHWEDFYTNSDKYHKVGRVVREEGWLEKLPKRKLCEKAQKSRPKRNVKP